MKLVQKGRSLLLPIALCLSLLVLPAGAAEPNPLPGDLDGSAWYAPAAAYCLEQELLKPDPDGRYRPEALLSKIEFISLLSRGLGLYQEGEEDFGAAKYKHFAAIADKGYIDRAQYPESDWALPVARFEVAEMLYRVVVARGGYAEDGSVSGLDCAADRGEILQGYRPAVNCVYRLGLMSGVDDRMTFQGWGGIMRSAGWAVIWRLQEPGARLTDTAAVRFPKLLSQYSTSYNQPMPSAPAMAAGRRGSLFNMNRAGETIDGLVLEAGGTFSYNQHIGYSGKDEGYVLGIVLSDGKGALGYGGGVCQASGTLFQAALRANLTITERHCHGQKSAYLPAGMDSTLSPPWLDLKFKNPYDTPVMIVFQNDTAAKTLTMKIYGGAQIKVPAIELKTTALGSGRYRLVRYADGTANYTTYSQYKV